MWGWQDHWVCDGVRMGPSACWALALLMRRHLTAVKSILVATRVSLVYLKQYSDTARPCSC